MTQVVLRGLGRGSLRKHPFLLALRRWGRFARMKTKSEEKRMFSQAKGGVEPYSSSSVLDLISCSTPNETRAQTQRAVIN